MRRQTRRGGQGQQHLGGTAGQITGNLKRREEAGLTMPLLWPPLQSIIDVPVSQALDDM